MKNRKSILLVVLLLAVGFAAVSTTIYINGSTNIIPNQDDFNVYYSDAYVNGVQNKSVITNDTHIVFETELSTLGEEYILDYEVTNGSKNYDAELVMECTSDNDYLTVTNEFDDDSILVAKDSREGRLTLELTKSNAGEDVDVTITCIIDANAIERESLGIANRSEISVEAKDENNTNLNAKAYEITGSDAEELLSILSTTALVDTTENIDALIEVESGDFDSIATTTFDVSSIASEGDKVVILHFNEVSNEWEYISEEIVDSEGKVTANFTSFSPVAFAVKKSQIERICKLKVGETLEFDYTGKVQELDIPCYGTYQIEVWGSQGGTSTSKQGVTYLGGYGAYAVGTMQFDYMRKLYIYVGGQEIAINGGGGYGAYTGNSNGGDSTHILLQNNKLSDLENSKDDILIVAGGGGGGFGYATLSTSNYSGNGGHAGGVIGNKGLNSGACYWTGTGGTQLQGGTNSYCSGINSSYDGGIKIGHSGIFGQGGDLAKASGAGGGGGYFGGAAAHYAGGGGGSSYIGNPYLTEKAMYCYECVTSEDEDTKTISVKIASDDAIANTPKKGNGYARITLISIK